MGKEVRQQAERLYDTFAELVRGYQFRDREEICCHGISVSQCHVLDALDTDGPLTMGDLARRLYVEVSTMTRVVDQLVGKQLVKRVQDTADRRVWSVVISRSGRALVTTIKNEIVSEHEEVLRGIPVQSRKAVIAAMEGLLAAFKDRHEQLSGQRCGK